VNYSIELLTIDNQSRSILRISPHPNPNPKMESSLGEIFDQMESRLEEILDRMEARLLEIITVAKDKQQAEPVSFTTNSTADEHFTEFDNEVVPGCIVVTRIDVELAAFDHENGDPFVASISADLSFDNKLGGRSRARTDVVLDDGPLFDEEPAQLATATRFVLDSNRDATLTCSTKFLNILVNTALVGRTKGIVAKGKDLILISRPWPPDFVIFHSLGPPDFVTFLRVMVED
jgi:hypothetical protein